MNVLLLITALLGMGTNYTVKSVYAAIPPVVTPWMTSKFVEPIRPKPMLAQRRGSLWMADLQGVIRIDETNKVIHEDLDVTYSVSGTPDTIQVVDMLKLESVQDADGNDLAFSQHSSQGISYVSIDISGLTFTNTLTLHLVMEGTLSGSVSLYSPILGNFGDITYIGGWFLPFTGNNDLFISDLWLEVPKGRMLAASGRTMEIDRSGPDWDRFHCVSGNLMDSYSLTIGNFDRNTTITDSGRIVEAYLKPADFGTAETAILTLVHDVVDFYTSRYGDPQFAKIGLSQIPDEVGAGLGWPGLVWLAKVMLFGQGAGHRDAYVAHELGHQWFPDTLKINDSLAPWLSEGFAEYSSVTFMGHEFGVPYAAAVREMYGLYYRSVTDQKKGYALTSISAAQSPDMDIRMIITYYKGSDVVATLESIIGTDAFEAAIAKIHEENAGNRKYYNTMGLKKYLEDASGMDLDPYFTEWVYHTGYPIYTLGITREQNNGKWTAHLHVNASTSEPETPFTMPVHVVVVDEGGTETKQTIQVDMGIKTFDVSTAARPVRVEFDPEYRFIKKITPEKAGDIDYSGEVDCRDLAIVAAVSGAHKYSDPVSVSRYDQNGDHRVDIKDVNIIIKELNNAL